MSKKHVPTENKILIIEILRWAKIIADAGYGHVMFVPGEYVSPPGDEQDTVWED